MPAISLDGIANAYRRAQRSIVRGMEDAADFDDDARFAALELDQNIVDAAFFVLIFGQLERRITDLAVHKVKRQNQRVRCEMLSLRKGLRSLFVLSRI